MGKIMVESWVFNENDKAQIKQYKNQIALKFKVANFSSNNPQEFFETFDLKSFEFIPCIKEGLRISDFWNYSYEIGIAIMQAVENEKITFSANELANSLEELTGASTRYAIGTIIFQNCLEKDVVDWILDNCDEKTKVGFLNWILEKQ